MKVIVALCVLLLSAVSGSALYGVVTDLTEDFLEVYTVSINPQTGAISKVVDNFVYLTQESVTYDGISGFDQNSNVFYYSTDYDSTFLFRADVKKKVLLAPLSLGAKQIVAITYYSRMKNFLLTFVDAQNNLLVDSYGSSGYTNINVLDQFGSSFSSATVDSVHQLYYFTGVHVNGSIYLGNFNASISSTTVYTSVLNCGNPAKTYPSYIAYDNLQDKIFGVASSWATNSLKYLSITIDPNTNACSMKPIVTAEYGIATCFTYDPTLHTLYFGWAPNGLGKVYSLDVNNGTITPKNGVVLNPPNVLSDIEAQYTVK